MDKTQINQKRNKLALISFILLFTIPFLPWFQPINFILGIIAYLQIRKSGEKGRNLALTVIVVGGIAILLILFGAGYYMLINS